MDKRKPDELSLPAEKTDVSGSISSNIDDDEAPGLEKLVWWKLDLSVLGVLTVIYLLSWLDRTNLGNARVAGLQKDLRLTNDQYSLSLTVTLIPYIFAELPVTLLLKIVGPNILIPAILTLWGVVTTLQGIVHNFFGLVACRFFLGLLEGGLLPCLILYLSLFYPRARLQKRLSVIFSASSMAGAFSGLLAAGILEMDGIGGRPGWAWILILEGLFTVLFGIFAFFFVPRSPMECSLLSIQERKYVIKCLREDGAISKDHLSDGFSWVEVMNAFRSPHVWFLVVLSFLNGIILYSLSYFTPSIVQGLGFSANRAQLMSVPPYAVAFVLTNIASYVADRYQCRGLTIIFCSTWCTVGFAMFLASHNKNVQYGSLFLTISGINALAPAITTWSANNSTPHVRRATAVASICLVNNAGGILSTWLLGSISAPPRYTSATIVLLACSIGIAVSAAVNAPYLWYQNKKKAELRATLTKEDEPEGLGDRSPWFIYIL